MPPVYECSSPICKRFFLVSQVASEVPGSNASGEIICPHCKTVCVPIEPEFGRSGERFVVTDRLPLERENALRQEKGLPPLPR
jgi:hypothetical protein